MGFITITQQKIENQTDSKNSNEKEKIFCVFFHGNSWNKSEFLEKIRNSLKTNYTIWYLPSQTMSGDNETYSVDVPSKTPELYVVKLPVYWFDQDFYRLFYRTQLPS